MDIRKIQNPQDLDRYDAWIKSHPEGNFWQSLERKQYLESLGKRVRIYIAEEHKKIVGSALVMIDRTSFGLRTWDIPRGPIGNYRKGVLEKVIADAKKDNCISVYCSPYQTLQVTSYKLQDSKRLQHCEATRIIDLTKAEEEILAQMKPKGRYNIRVAEKRGVTVEQSDDIDAYFRLAQETGKRDQYTIVSKTKYEKLLKIIPNTFLLMAFQKNEPIAGLLGVVWNKKAIYYYGASNHAHRASMAPYLLQWAAIQFCKASECTSYDVLGISPIDSTSHPWDGISSFKEKFGGDVVTYPPEQEIILKPLVKRMLDIKRLIV